MVKKVESVVQSFKDNVVIVTGAGKGIGREFGLMWNGRRVFTDSRE